MKSFKNIAKSILKSHAVTIKKLLRKNILNVSILSITAKLLYCFGKNLKTINYYTNDLLLRRLLLYYEIRNDIKIFLTQHIFISTAIMKMFFKTIPKKNVKMFVLACLCYAKCISTLNIKESLYLI